MFNRIITWFKNADRSRRMKFELSLLTDRDLSDIGVTRSQLNFDIKREIDRNTL